MVQISCYTPDKTPFVVQSHYSAPKVTSYKFYYGQHVDLIILSGKNPWENTTNL
jgi:hypothetical protein